MAASIAGQFGLDVLDMGEQPVQDLEDGGLAVQFRELGEVGGGDAELHGDGPGIRGNLPRTSLRMVDLPDPFLPIRPTRSPASSRKKASRSTGVLSKLTLTSFSRIKLIDCCPIQGVQAPKIPIWIRQPWCGAKEIRTPDLFDANEALYQLSYSPGTARSPVGAAGPVTLGYKFSGHFTNRDRKAPAACDAGGLARRQARRRCRTSSRLLSALWALVSGFGAGPAAGAAECPASATASRRLWVPRGGPGARVPAVRPSRPRRKQAWEPQQVPRCSAGSPASAAVLALVSPASRATARAASRSSRRSAAWACGWWASASNRGFPAGTQAWVRGRESGSG